MDSIREFLSAVRDAGLVAGNFRGLLHIAIGRTITRPDGTVVTSGVTWRELAGELKYLKFDTELVREYGADPDKLAARDRERFWYSAIAAAKVDSPEAVAEAEAFVPKLQKLGYHVSPPPGSAKAAGAKPPSPPPATAKPKSPPKPKDEDDKTGKQKKK